MLTRSNASVVAFESPMYPTTIVGMVVEDTVGAMGVSRMALEAAYYDDNGHGLNRKYLLL